MFLSDLSIKRPVFATVMMLALVTLGLFSYNRLSVDMYPNVEAPFVMITTIYEGASPETIEREVTKKIEEAVNPIAGVKHVNSSSREGVSVVFVEFQLEVRANDAAQETQTKIAAIRGELPEKIEEPIIQKLDFNSAPVIAVVVRSDRVSVRDLTTLVDKKIRRRFENLVGVGKVDMIGGTKREVNINVDPRRLQALGMGVDEVIGGIRSENVNAPVGRLNRKGVEVPVRVSGKPETVDQFSGMVIAQRNGVPIRLGELAQVVDGVEEVRKLALVDGKPAVTLDILKQSGANTVEVVDRVKTEVAKLTQEVPAEVSITTTRDSSIMIRDSLHDVQITLLIGAILTVLIVFCFLNSWRSTVITGLTLPISVISAYIVMYFLNMTLNVMTLMALSLAIGMLIDDAIVVRENIVRHLERGKDHFTAAREGTAEIGLAVLATTMSIVAVFVPVAFMKGIVGRFFFQFGITVTFAVLVSLFVSFTLDPMLSSRWNDPAIHKEGRRGPISRWLDRFNTWFDRSADSYKRLISWALRRRWLVAGLAGLAFALGAVCFFLVGGDFFPRTDNAEFQLNFTTAPDASIVETRDRLERVLRAIQGFPEIQQTYATIGAGDSGTVRDARIFVKLTPKSERRRSQRQVQALVRDEIQQISGILPSINEGTDSMAQKPIQLLIRGEEIPKLKKYAAQLKAAIYKIPGVYDLEVTMEQDIPEFQFQVDRDRAFRAGVMTSNVVQTVGALVGGQAISTYEDQDGDGVDIRVRLPLDLRQDLTQVQDLRITVPGADGRPALIPLGELVHYSQKPTPSQIDRRDLRRQVVISANFEGAALNEVNEKILAEAAKLNLEPGYSVFPAGDVEIMLESFGYLGEALLLAVIFVYLILAAQFESFIDPLAIMLSLPLSIVGMAGMLLLTGDTINIMSLIGLIMLMGLVTKNAILLVDFAKHMRQSGLERAEAIAEAGRTRLRPIIMTTLAMIFGMLPLALALGPGAEMRAPMARAVIGGLITSTLLTLIVVPVIYTFLDDFASWIHRRWIGGKETHA